jgi:hypothetical protein
VITFVSGSTFKTEVPTNVTQSALSLYQVIPEAGF